MKDGSRFSEPSCNVTTVKRLVLASEASFFRMPVTTYSKGACWRFALISEPKHCGNKQEKATSGELFQALSLRAK